MSHDDDYEEDETADVKAEELPKGAITVTINVDQWLNGSLQDVVVKSLVNSLQKQISGAVKEAVETKMLELADQQFQALATEKLEEFFTKAHRKTNGWGEPTGQTYSVRELLTDRFQQYLGEKVDSDGRPSSYSGSLPRSQHMLNTLAHKPLQEALNETVKAFTAQAKTQIQASVSRYIAEQLAPTISVPAIKG
ncbi:hypothetical protein GAY28_08150 [Azospirillum brasilense]|nr:hypothetical protein [Azospirillum brasilense]